MRIIIAGAGAVGTHLAKMLSDEQHDIVLMDADEERMANLDSNFDLMTIAASPTSISSLKDASVADADLFGVPVEDPYKRAASYVDGALSILTGISANKSIATGMPVDVMSLVDLPGYRKI